MSCSASSSLPAGAIATPMLALRRVAGCAGSPRSRARIRSPISTATDALGDLADDDELITAVPGNEIAGAHARQQPLRDVAQHPVAGLMAQSIVDALEAVEVDEQHCAPGRAHDLVHLSLQQPPVRQACHLVVSRGVRQLGLQPKCGERLCGLTGQSLRQRSRLVVEGPFVMEPADERAEVGLLMMQRRRDERTHAGCPHRGPEPGHQTLAVRTADHLLTSASGR